MTAARSAKSRDSRDSGYSIVEAAITIPAMVLMIMIVVQGALLWHARHVVEAAARDGVEAARGYQASSGDGEAAALAYLRDVSPTLVLAPSVTVSRTPEQASIRIHAHVIRVIPFGDFTVEESASGPIERFVAGGLG